MQVSDGGFSGECSFQQQPKRGGHASRILKPLSQAACQHARQRSLRNERRRRRRHALVDGVETWYKKMSSTYIHRSSPRRGEGYVYARHHRCVFIPTHQQRNASGRQLLHGRRRRPELDRERRLRVRVDELEGLVHAKHALGEARAARLQEIPRHGLELGEAPGEEGRLAPCTRLGHAELRRATKTRPLWRPL